MTRLAPLLAALFTLLLPGMATAQAVDERGLWAAYQRGDYAAVAEEILTLRRLQPDWRPPETLLALLRRAETRREVAADAEAQRWTEIVALLRSQPDQFTPADIDNLWAAATAPFRLGDRAGAYALYEQVASGCNNADLCLATLAKALANRDDKRLDHLLAMARPQLRTADEQARLAQIERDFRGAPATPKGRLGLALADLAKGGASPEQLAWIAAATLQLKDAEGADALGWRAFQAGQWPEAQLWFEHAMDWAPSGDAALGLASALLAQGDLDGAERVGLGWQATQPSLAAVLDAVRSRRAADALARGDFALALRLTEPPRPGAPSANPIVHGWALTQLGRPVEAGRVFAEARGRAETANDLSAVADAEYGMALALVAQGLAPEARAVAAARHLEPDKAARLDKAILRQETLDAFDAGAYRRALTLLQQVQASGPGGDPLDEVEAWSLFQTQRYEEAWQVFHRLQAAHPTAENFHGMSLAAEKLNPRN